MDKDFSYSDVLIYEEAWNNFNSKSNFDANMIDLDDSNTDPLESNLRQGFGPKIYDLDTPDTVIDLVNGPDHDFNNCMDQVELWTRRAMMVYKEHESALENSAFNQDHLMKEIKQRDELIQRLQEELVQEKVRRSQQVYRLELELHMMGNMVKEYREQLKDVNRNFEEYRARVLQSQTHRDNAMGSGGPIVSTKEYDQKTCALRPLN